MTTLAQIVVSQAQKEVTANANFAAVSVAALFAQNLSTTTGLTWGYYGGQVYYGGSFSLISNGTLSLSNNTTNYIEATAAGVVSSNTSGFTSGSTSLQEVVTLSGQISTVTDYRLFPLVQGASPSASWTPGFTGFSADPTVTANYLLLGKLCFINIYTSADGTSNTTGFTITGLPFTAAGITGAIMYCGSADDNSIPSTCFGSVSGTTLTLYYGASVTAASWTNSGNKGASLSFFYEIA